MRQENGTVTPGLWQKLGSALLYAASSCLITVVNKSVLTIYAFPSFCVVGIGQMVATIVVLEFCKATNIVSYPDLSVDVLKKVWPLPLMYMGNMVFGLGGTQALSLPMMTVLRRFSILMTMIGEIIILKKNPSVPVQMSVFLIILGSMIAASDDLAFNLVGYIFVLLNDLFSAGNNVYIKKKMETKDIGKYGLLFFNSVCMLPPLFLYAYLSGDLQRSLDFEGWVDPWFCFQFFLCSIFGFIMMFTLVLCTHFNSALASTVIGCGKNIVVTYIGMFFGGDYVFSIVNFMGLNISILGTIVYTKVTFLEKNRQVVSVQDCGQKV